MSAAVCSGCWPTIRMAAPTVGCSRMPALDGTHEPHRNLLVLSDLEQTKGLLAAAPKNSVVLENVQSLGNGGYGIAVASGSDVVISRSILSGNGIARVEAGPGAQVFVDNTEISHNVTGVLPWEPSRWPTRIFPSTHDQFQGRPCRMETTDSSATAAAPRRRPSAAPRPISVNNNNRAVEDRAGSPGKRRASSRQT
jgi:hypothetical protein